MRRKLAEYMRAQAAWRVALAAREPRSAAAHRRSAQAIEAWAQYVEGLPDSDASLAAIAEGQALIGSPPEFHPRSDGGGMIREHGYPRTIEWDQRSGALGRSHASATRQPPPNETLMRELALLEGSPRPAEDVAST